MNAKHILLVLLLGYLPASALAVLNLSQIPLFIASTEPRIMLVSSRDHQLSIKAYTDYSDIDSNGTLDITYNDSISYYGYFDSNKCYNYSSSRFEPAGNVLGFSPTDPPSNHHCSGQWSGNFMNWATMTRMDVMRKAFYGGYRSTDTTGASAVTVLERHFLPVDVHAFVKVFNPNDNATLKKYMPATVVGNTNTAMSLCNVSDTTSTTLTGQMSFPLAAPLVKIAGGTWPQWDSSEVNQCQTTVSSTQPANNTLISATGTATNTGLNVRVKVCDSTIGLEDNCKKYTNPGTGVQTIKPVGLLQQYGDVDASRRARFGLMTGSYKANKSGGVLRKNIGLITNNNNLSIASSSVCGNNNTDDEIDVCTGQFINQASNQAGIINTLNRLHIAGFQYNGSGGNASHQYGCNSPGKLSFNNGECVDWGNPLSETYLETLRYFAGASASAAFDVSDSTPTNILSSIPKVTWTDPLPSEQWCALSTIVVLSTGLNSFDTDQLASFTPSGGSAIDAATLTNTIGDSSHENINGNSYLIGNLIGGSGSNINNQCTAKTVSNLSSAKGICPQVPSTEGGYGIAGLAYAPKTIDLRPGYAALRDTRWGGATGINQDWALRQPITTYTVQLAESLPSFSTPVGSGTVTLLPACQANSNGSPGVWTSTSTGWRNCSMTNLIVNNNVDMASVGVAPLPQTKTCSGNGTTSRCFTVAWEDSTWGNDYDMDGIERLGFCVGSACDSFRMLCPTTSSATARIGAGVTPGWSTSGSTASTQMRIVSCVIQTQAGHALTFGYTLTGTTADGAYFPILRPGGSNFNVGSVLPGAVTAPNAATYSQGSSSAKLLKNPLWYAAKYGGFTESTPTAGTPVPDLVSEWDIKNNLTGAAGADGDPDNYFDIRNPANLITALSNVFDRASQPDASAASVATNSTNLKIESRVFQAKFSSADWSGQLLSYKINTSGVLNPIAEWDAGEIINSQSPINEGNPGDRVIITKGATDGVAFSYANLTSSEAALLNKDASGVTDNCGLERVDYLRGDDTREGSAGTFTCASASITNKFRQRRTSRLSDIVGSSPWYVGQPSAGLSDVSHPGYSAFRKSKLSRTPMVYAGANDGMLHGFDASLDLTNPSVPEGTPTATSGMELLAYIPTDVYSNLNRLSDQTYNKNHRYFVDGSPMTGDADLDSSTINKWATVLVGSMGAGGKGYYALDVSDPVSNFKETGSAPADTLLWEFNEADMGYVFNMPPVHTNTSQAKQIVKMANGKWAAVVGNGYNSSLGKAVLYVLFIEQGIDGSWAAGDYVKLVADAPIGSDNGLSTPVPFDSNNDGYADTVYAGDLKGHMWKFLVGPNGSDISVTTAPSTWKVAFSSATCGNTTPSTCIPLFTATTSLVSPFLPQPIIAPPEVTEHPKGGQLVLFGTGKYMVDSDITNTDVQSFYGIWDKHDVAGTSVGLRASELRQQTVLSVATTAAGSFRINSANPINWRITSGGSPANCVSPCTPTHMGWYIDLPSTKERVTGIPKFINNVIFFNTLIPSDIPCDAGGTGWLMSLDFESGSMGNRPIFDTNADGNINKLDTIVGGYLVGAVIGGTTLIQSSSTTEPQCVGAGCTPPPCPPGTGVSSQTSGAMTATQMDLGCGFNGRLNWREIVQ